MILRGQILKCHSNQWYYSIWRQFRRLAKSRAVTITIQLYVLLERDLLPSNIVLT